MIVLVVTLFIVWQNKESPTTEVSPYTTGHASTTTQTSFGDLKNVYSDAEFNFSLKYPDEIGITQAQKSCHTDLYFMNERGYPLFMSLYSPSCPSPFANLPAQSLDDYKKDYTLDNGVIISIVNTESVSSSLVSQGIRQEYFIFSDVQEMENSDFSTRIPSVRYVFYNKEKGFYILQVVYLGDTQDPYKYKELEEKIIKTVEY